MKILIILYDAIGDSILTTPFLRGLRILYGDSADITLIAHSRSVALVKQYPFIDNVVEFSRGDKLSFFKTLIELRKHKYDILLDLWDEKFSTLMKILLKLTDTERKIAIKKRV